MLNGECPHCEGVGHLVDVKDLVFCGNISGNPLKHQMMNGLRNRNRDIQCRTCGYTENLKEVTVWARTANLNNPSVIGPFLPLPFKITLTGRNDFEVYYCPWCQEYFLEEDLSMEEEYISNSSSDSDKNYEPSPDEVEFYQ